MTKKGFIFLTLLILTYSFIAFYNLGDTTSPQNTWIFAQDDVATVDFGEVRQIDEIQYMSASFIGKEFIIYFSDDYENWTDAPPLTVDYVFYWHVRTYEPFTARYAAIMPVSDFLVLQELAFRFEGELLPIVERSEEANDLFDEQQYVPTRQDFMNSAYFDEIYHARTAYEFNYKLEVYEWTHPPLGKFIISQGIKLFGMTPFGWRFMGTLFGVLMIIPLYFFAKRLFGSENWALLAAFIFSFDFMHFAQTRLATIDTYVTIFIMLMYYCMFIYATGKYTKKNFYKSLIPLLCSGIFMGLALSSKWQGAYAIIGLAIVFFIALFQKRKIFTSGQIIKTLLSCFVIFIIVPISIYIISYVPFLTTFNKIFGLSGIIQNNINMFNYHAYLVDEHPFTSRWWTWVLNLRPIMYYFNYVTEEIKQGISSFGNPAVWWMGILAFIYCLFSSIKDKNKIALLLVISYLSQLLPWMFISRTTYIYHYFPSVPFIVLMNVFMFKNLIYVKFPKSVYIYAALVLILFIVFYPVLTGMPVTDSYVKYLKWLPGWQLLF